MKHGQPETNSPGPLPGRVFSPGDPVTIRGRIYRVRSNPIRGRRGTVYQVEDNRGRRLALKIAADRRRESLRSLGRERKKARAYRRYGFPHAAIVAAGPGYVLKEWVEGVRGDEWVREWARQGFPPEAGPWIRLTEMLLHGIRRRVYLRDLNQNNLVWDGAGWTIIDAGSANRLLRRSRVRRLYLQEIPLDWGRAAGPGAEEPIRELLEAVFAAR